MAHLVNFLFLQFLMTAISLWCSLQRAEKLHKLPNSTGFFQLLTLIVFVSVYTAIPSIG